jgi:8-oxo-dGTP diphosphatase
MMAPPWLPQLQRRPQMGPYRQGSECARRSVGVVTSDSAPAPGPDLPDPTALPAIPVSAGALLFDKAGRLLIVKPTYKSGWTIPGGVMEADGETPWEACQREVREETGIEARHGQLACMDFRRPRPGKPGGIRFLFRCDQVDDEDLTAIVLQPEELSAYQILALPDALRLLRHPIQLRVKAATSSGGLVYLEDGLPVADVGTTHPGPGPGRAASSPPSQQGKMK